MALTPTTRGLENASRAVFLTMPLRVAMTTYLSAEKFRTLQKAVMVSPFSMPHMLTIGLPLASFPPVGILWTFTQ